MNVEIKPHCKRTITVRAQIIACNTSMQPVIRPLKQGTACLPHASTLCSGPYRCTTFCRSAAHCCLTACCTAESDRKKPQCCHSPSLPGLQLRSTDALPRPRPLPWPTRYLSDSPVSSLARSLPCALLYRKLCFIISSTRKRPRSVQREGHTGAGRAPHLAGPVALNGSRRW